MTATPTVDREALRRKSAPLLLCERARALPDAVAFRCKHLGLYRERNWRDYAALVAEADLIVDTRNAIKEPHAHVFKLGAPRPAHQGERIVVA